MIARYKLLSRGAPVGAGVMGADYVAVSGVAKSASAAHPYAVANELLCGQLGRGLGLPIPPGFIIDDAGTPWHVSLNFNLAGQQLPPADCAALVNAYPSLAAGIVVFDSWIVNADRHPGNLAFDQASGGVNVFDHSHAFYAATFGRQYLERFENSALADHNCLTQYLTDLTAVDEWLTRLDQIPRFWVESAVRDALAVGLPAADEQFCIDYLLGRRTRLRDLLRQQQHAFRSVTPQLWAQF
jgi:hypothetical protein